MVLPLITVFLGAFLVFFMQPLLGKHLLPWFGGGPAIWSACLVFFQSNLFVGYLWAYLLDRHLSGRKQALVHILAVFLSVGLVIVLWALWKAPILPDKPNLFSDSTYLPVLRIFLILSVSVGLPYCVLCSTSPLLQVWVRDTKHNGRVWPMYALSNAGSVLGLLCYPFLVEPNLPIVLQGQLWGGLYLLFALLMVWCAWPLVKKGPSSEQVVHDTHVVSVSSTSGTQRLLWLSLSATAVVLLMAATNQMCQEIAVIPFLWVVPLTVYLFSLIFTFQNEKNYRRLWFAPGLVVTSAVAIWALYQEYNLSVSWQVVIYSLLVFFGCMVCHGELFKHRPSTDKLAVFYLMLALGGGLGGVFVSLIAPLLFNGYWEFHLSLVLCTVLFWISYKIDYRTKNKTTKLAWLSNALALGYLILLSVFLWNHISRYNSRCLESTRNFYGVLRVKLTHPNHPKFYAHDLFDGQILHGFQFQDPLYRSIPTSYFSNSSGLALVLANHAHRKEGKPLKVGVIGLGIGTAAALAVAGDRFRFYEINPEVIRIARSHWFSFLRDSPAQIKIIEGDARLSLAAELQRGQSQQFDVFVIDAFQSDAIPIHLLTLQAMQLYSKHLKADGIILVHVTNLSLSLEPIVDRLATEMDYVVATIRDTGDGWQSLRSHWMVLTREPSILANPQIAAKSELPQKLADPAPLWTDDFSSILPIIR